jgi:iron complex outermembrane recepter protein
MTGYRTAVGLVVSLALCAASHGREASRRDKVSFDIDAPSMVQALMQFTEQSGLQLAFPMEGAGSLPARRVVGEYTPTAALQVLLADSGLQYEFANDRTIAIRARAVPLGGEKRSAGESALAGAIRLAAGEAQSASVAGDDAVIEDGQFRKGVPEVLVKGSRSLNVDIQRTEDDVQPYVVFDRSEIDKSGATNIEEFLRSRLTAQSSAATTAQSLASGNNASNVDLRGLGPNQTLILINGRRASPLNTLGTTGQADLNGIPLSAIERIEVLPATASGIYGGGATGGVVNVILRRDYSGVETALTYGNSFEGGGGSRRVEVAGGFQLEGGRTSVTLTGSYSDSTDLYWADRDLLQRARQTAIENNPAGFYSTGNPILGATTNISTLDGSPLSLKPQFGGANLGSAITFVPSGYQGVASDNGAGLVANAGRYNADLAPTAQSFGGGQASLISNPTVKSIATSVRRTFTSNIDGFLELAASENEAASRTSNITAPFFIPAGAAGNPFDQDILVSTPALGTDQILSNEHRNYRAVIGTIFSLGGSWRGGVDYTWSQARTRTRLADGQIGFEGSLAVMDGVTASGASFDIFRDTRLSGLDFSPYLTAISTRTPLELEMHDVAARVSGPLPWSLPAGAPTVSFLVEYRRETLDDVTTSGVGFNQIAYDRGQNVRSVYLETIVPLIAARAPAQQNSMLDLQLAVRRDEYRVTGANLTFEIPGILDPGPRTAVTRKLSSVDPTVSLRFEPVRDIAFRTTYSTGFLPPAMNQLVPDVPIVTAVPFLTDPRRGNEPIGEITILTGGNALLRPEESKSWSAGFVLMPSALAGLRFSADWVNIEKTDNITLFGLNQDNINNEQLIPGFLTRGPASGGFDVGPIIGLNNQNMNVAEQRVEAIDLKLDYRQPLGGLGDVTVALAATRNLHNTVKFSASAPELENVRLSNVLPWQGNLELGWDRGPWSAQWVSRYFDSYCLLSGCTEGPATLSQGSTTVPSQLYHDVSVRYRFAQGMLGSLLDDTDVSLGATNIFDRKPPVDLSTGVPYSTYGDPRLASYYLTVRKSF